MNGKILKIWAILMIVIAILVYAGCFALTNVFDKILMPAMTGYSKKSGDFLYPYENSQAFETDEEQAKKLSTYCYVRSMFNNDCTHYTFPQLKSLIVMDTEQAYRFVEKDGNSELQSGIWERAFRSDDESSYSYSIFNCIGLVDINKLCEKEESRELYNVLEKNRDAVIQINSYIQNKALIEPVSVTVRDSGGNVILETEFSHGDGDLIICDDIKLSNRTDEDAGFNNIDVYLKMKLAYRGERKVDRLAEKYAEKIKFDGERITEKKFGFVSLKSVMYESNDDYGMIVIFYYNLVRIFIIWTVILGLVMTGIMAIVVKIKAKRNSY